MLLFNDSNTWKSIVKSGKSDVKLNKYVRNSVGRFFDFSEDIEKTGYIKFLNLNATFKKLAFKY